MFYSRISNTSKIIKRVILFLITLIIIALTVVFLIDNKLYYYGKNKWNLYATLPLRIIPQYWGIDNGYLGFVLTDEAGSTLVAHGNKYWTSNIEVNEIIKYGFNKQKLVALVNDSLNNEYYVVCSKDNDIRSKQSLKIYVLKKNIYLNDKSLKWIDIKGVSTANTEILRNYSLLLSIL